MFDYLKLLRKYNTLEAKYNELESYLKEDCFKQMLLKVGEPIENKRLKNENKKLRIKIKELKTMIRK